MICSFTLFDELMLPLISCSMVEGEYRDLCIVDRRLLASCVSREQSAHRVYSSEYQPRIQCLTSSSLVEVGQSFPVPELSFILIRFELQPTPVQCVSD